MKFKITVYGNGLEFFHVVGNKEAITAALKDYFSDEPQYESCLLASLNDIRMSVEDEEGNEVFSTYDLSENIESTEEDYYFCGEGEYLLMLNYVNKGTWFEAEIEADDFDFEKFKIGVIENNSGTFINTYLYDGEEFLDEGADTIPKYENLYVYDSNDNLIDYTEFYDPDNEG